MMTCSRAMPGAAAACGLLWLTGTLSLAQTLPPVLRLDIDGTGPAWEYPGLGVALSAGADAVLISPTTPGAIGRLHGAAASVGVVSGRTGRLRLVGENRFWMDGGVEDPASSRRRLALGGVLVGQQIDDQHGAELGWMSLETGAWSMPVSTLAGPLGGEPRLVTAGDGFVCFVAYDQDLRPRVWRCAGPGAPPEPVLPHGSAWTLAAHEGGVLALGYELDRDRTVLWRIPHAGEVPVTLLAMPGAFPAGLVVSGATAEFATSQSISAGDATLLWRTDGTWAGTEAFAAAPGRAVLIASGGADPTTPRFLKRVLAGGWHELWAVTPAHGPEAERLTAFAGEITSHALAGTSLVVALGTHPGGADARPWASDGTPQGTRPLNDDHGRPLRSARVWCGVGNAAYFTAADPAHGAELWQMTDGAAAPLRLADLAPGPTSSWPRSAAVFNHRLVVGAMDEAGQPGLWMIDLCAADFDNDGQNGVEDVLSYLTEYFAAAPRAEHDGVPGITVTDLLNWLATFNGGCP